MGSAIVNELKGKVDAAWGRLTRQLQDMEPHMERSAAPGEWTPVFKRFMGTDEISIQVYVSAFFDLHWNDHAGQIAKIRQAVGLPEAK